MYADTLLCLAPVDHFELKECSQRNGAQTDSKTNCESKQWTQKALFVGSLSQLWPPPLAVLGNPPVHNRTLRTQRLRVVVKKRQKVQRETQHRLP